MKFQDMVQLYSSEREKFDSEIDFLKHIYIILGRKRTFDARYYFGNSATTKKIYKLAQREKIAPYDEYSVDGKRTIICVSLSYEIQRLMNELGYNCIVTHSDEIGGHIFPIVVLSDGRKIKYDLQRDLENIQTHCRTRFFAEAESDDYAYGLDVIDDDEQFDIDRDIGYVRTKEDYKDSAFARLDTVIKGNPQLSRWQKLDIILSDPAIVDIPDYTGYVEAYNFYTKRVLPRYFPKGSVNVIICSRKSKDNPADKDYTNCVYIDTPDAPEAVYLYSKAHRRYILTPFSKVLELEKDGLVIGNYYGGSSAKKLKRKIEQSIIGKKKDEESYFSHNI